MEKSSKEKIRLGIFVILGTVLLLIAAYLIGNRQNMFGQTFTISSVFRHVSGLQNGNNVRYSGINVGTVKDIQMEADTVIRVSMLISEGMLPHIKRNAVATIGSDGLVGSMIVNIVPGEGQGEAIRPGDEIASYSRIATADMLSTLNVTNENAAKLTADLLQVTEAMKNGKGTMGRLLNDTAMAENLTQTLANLRAASYQANGLLGELNKVFSEDKMAQSVAGVLLTDSLAGQRVDSLLYDLGQSGKQLGVTLGKVDSLVSYFAEGEGALKYFANDTVFVNRLALSMKHIEEGTARFNENMEALKHNFLTRRYFRKLEREKARAAKEE